MADMIQGGLAAFFPLYAVKHGMANPGLFFSTFAISIVATRALGGRVFNFRERDVMILPCLLIYIVAIPLLLLSKTVPIFLLAALIWGIGQGFLFPLLAAYALELAGGSRGPAMGTFGALDDLGIGLGPVIMGIVLGLTNYPVMFLCLGCTCLINLCYFWFFLRGKTKYQASQVGTAPALD